MKLFTNVTEIATKMKEAINEGIKCCTIYPYHGESSVCMTEDGKIDKRILDLPPIAIYHSYNHNNSSLELFPQSGNSNINRIDYFDSLFVDNISPEDLHYLRLQFKVIELYYKHIRLYHPKTFWNDFSKVSISTAITNDDKYLIVLTSMINYPNPQMTINITNEPAIVIDNIDINNIIASFDGARIRLYNI